MATDVQVPALGESITEGTLAQWLKKPGEAVAADEPIASLETDKVSVEVPSPIAGVLTEQLVAEGATVAVGAPIARIDENASRERDPGGGRSHRHDKSSWSGRESAASRHGACAGACTGHGRSIAGDDHITTLSPAVRRAVLEYHVDPTKIRGTGKDGRLTKDDVLAAAQGKTAAPEGRGPGAACESSGCTRAAGEGGPASPASGARSASR